MISIDWAMIVLSLLIASTAFRQTLCTHMQTLAGFKLYSNKNSATMDPRREKIHEIYHIVFLLQQRLVRDVIPSILDYAELYECTTTAHTFSPTMRVTESRAPMPLLTCKITKPLARVSQPVRKIVFKLTSHDQGYASDMNAGSWTWFTAKKLPPAEESGQIGDDGDSTEASSAGTPKVIARNPIASRQWITHEVTWRADSKDPAESEWVSSLRTGECFVVHAWARFPGWVNHTSSVSVKVYTVAVA